ncbi:MAG: stage II sporulation protein R, partial [Oscillospiraceae bacterium]|nr:stage II sporulation protein R [Oscillospiraceae bacterium]
MKQAIGMLIWLLLAAAAASVYQTAESRRMLEQHVIRLHILANSDSTADQTDKLLVRDAMRWLHRFRRSGRPLSRLYAPRAVRIRCRSFSGRMISLHEVTGSLRCLRGNIRRCELRSVRVRDRTG